MFTASTQAASFFTTVSVRVDPFSICITRISSIKDGKNYVLQSGTVGGLPLNTTERRETDAPSIDKDRMS